MKTYYPLEGVNPSAFGVFRGFVKVRPVNQTVRSCQVTRQRRQGIAPKAGLGVVTTDGHGFGRKDTTEQKVSRIF
jgi:hypothetical protein